MAGKLKLVGSWVLVSVLDLEERVETAPDGTPFRYAIDPSTGLAMAPDQIHVPAGLVVAMGPDADRTLFLGARVIIQRNLGRQFEHDGMMVQAVQTMSACPECGTRYPSGYPAAVEGMEWEPVGRRIVVTREEVDERHALDVLGSAARSDVRWGRMLGHQPDWALGCVPMHGDLVAYVQGEHVLEWTESGVSYASVTLPSTCERCWCPLSGGAVVGWVKE